MKIKDIKVQSFVTNMARNERTTVKAGLGFSAKETELATCTFNSPECYNDKETKYPICQNG